MFSELVLVLWSCAGLAWWVIAWRLVCANRTKGNLDFPSDAAPLRTLSVFKPLPPLGAKGADLVAPGLESFAAQLDPESELLLGIHEADRDITVPLVEQLRAAHPKARIKVMFRFAADDVPNPKIAWQKLLSSQAEGELWLWSDADVVAPSGFLQSARQEFARCGLAMLTFPYVVREIPSPPALLEALFVNVEFYPGVLLLRQRGPVDFGLGAAMLFERDDFLRRVSWNEVGAWLADDFFLGQKLYPVGVGATTLATVPWALSWRDGLSHDLRWTKTIRWNRPLGAFARILIMPVVGWLVAVAFHPADFFAWLGLVGMIQADVLFAVVICRSADCYLKFGDVLRMEAWSFWRIVLWFICWLPWPVLWSGKVWRGPKADTRREPAFSPEGSMTEAVDNEA